MIAIILLYLTGMYYLALSRNQDASPAFLKISCFVLWFFMAFRSIDVGADTKQYCYGFEQIRKIKWTQLFNTPVFGIGGGYELEFEPGYRILNRLVGSLFTSNQAITIANSTIIIILLYWLIKKWSLNPVLSICLYLTLGIFQTEMNMARNAIAIMICYLAMKCVEDRKPIKYIVIVLLAMTVHSSAILFVPLYWLINKVYLTTKKTTFLLFLSIVIGLTFPFTRQYILYIVPSRFQRYFYGNTSRYESLLVGLLHICLFLLVLLFVNRDNRPQLFSIQNIGTWMFLLDIMFFCIGFDLSSASRMAALFGPYLMIFIPNLIETGVNKNKGFLISCIFAICGFQYLLRISINNIGSTMPYSFFWN